MDNPPAFPNKGYNSEIYNGMTLLDYFAGQALIAFGENLHDVNDENAAKQCYNIAEAMLKEREKRIN